MNGMDFPMKEKNGGSGTHNNGESVDQIRSLLGNFGRWQFFVIILLSIGGIPTAWQILVLTFLTPDVAYICNPHSDQEKSLEQWMELAKEKNQTKEFQCNAFEYDAEDGVSAIPNKTCDSWLYNTTFYPRTVITDFDLVCEHDYLVTVSQSIFMAGILLGAVCSGIISDKFGRKPTLILISLGLCLFGTVTAFANSIVLFIVLRFCVAFCTIALFTTAFVYCMEIVGGVWSSIIGIGLEFPWAIGYIMLPWIALAVPDWGYLQLTISLPLLIFIGIVFIVPENPRWLLSKGHLEDAEDVLDRALEINREESKRENLKLKKIDASVKEASILDLFRTPNMCKKTLIQYYLWFTCSFVYYGLTLNANDLIPGDLYTNFFVAGLIEFPAYALTIVVMLFFGRRIPLATTLLIGGVFLFLRLAFPDDDLGIQITSTLGKFGITSAFAIIYLYAAELYPTCVRNTGVGSSSMCARIGSILAPIVGRQLGRATYPEVPIVIFAIVSLIGAVAALMLPETSGKKLPDTLEEGEEFGKNSSIFDIFSKKSEDSRRPNTASGLDNKGFQGSFQ